MSRAPQPGSSQQEEAIRRILTASIEHIAAGRFDDAERVLASSGKAALRTPTGCNILGDIHLKQGRARDALRAFDSALKLVPSFPEAHCNRAVALQEMERYADALAAIDRALSYRADYPTAHYNRGNILEKLGRYSEAVAAYDRALKLQPAFPEARLNRGLALIADHKPLEAIADFRLALALRPKMIAAETARADAYRRLGRNDEALAAVAAALDIEPDNSDAALLKVEILIDKGRGEDALAITDDVIAREPENAKAWSRRSSALTELKRLDDALAAADEAVRLAPRDPGPQVARAIVFFEMARLEEQMAALDKARDLGASGRAYLHSRAVALLEYGDVDEALACFHEALKVEPASAVTHRDLSMLLLSRGQFAEGWAEHEWRLKTAGYKQSELAKLAPAWQGEDIAGKKLLIRFEQGLGDSIQFLRFVPQVRELGAQITLMLQSALHSIVKPTLPGVEVVESPGLRRFDFQISLMSLAYVLKVSEAALAEGVPYLSADPDFVAKWHPPIGTNGFKVGLVWQGNPEYRRDRYRSIPLAKYAPLSAVPGVRLISLQAHRGLDQLDDLPEGMTVETLGDEIAKPKGFDNLAGVMANLDLIVTSDTSSAHLAGALGRPTWIALRHRPDWRWMEERSDSPWYPTARLFRQKTHGDWDGVFAQMARELAKAAGGNARP